MIILVGFVGYSNDSSKHHLINTQSSITTGGYCCLDAIHNSLFFLVSVCPASAWPLPFCVTPYVPVSIWTFPKLENGELPVVHLVRAALHCIHGIASTPLHPRHGIHCIAPHMLGDMFCCVNEMKLLRIAELTYRILHYLPKRVCGLPGGVCLFFSYLEGT